MTFDALDRLNDAATWVRFQPWRSHSSSSAARWASRPISDSERASGSVAFAFAGFDAALPGDVRRVVVPARVVFFVLFVVAIGACIIVEKP